MFLVSRMWKVLSKHFIDECHFCFISKEKSNSSNVDQSEEMTVLNFMKVQVYQKIHVMTWQQNYRKVSKYNWHGRAGCLIVIATCLPF